MSNIAPLTWNDATNNFPDVPSVHFVSRNNETFHVARIHCSSTVNLIGYAVHNKGAWYGSDGKQFHVSKFDLLLNNADMELKWVDEHGKVPTGAIVGGFDPHGDRQYVARGKYQGYWYVGYMNKDDYELTFAVDGKVITTPDYEVLTAASLAPPEGPPVCS